MVCAANAIRLLRCQLPRPVTTERLPRVALGGMGVLLRLLVAKCIKYVYVNNNLNINGIVTGINIGVKTPIYFTTNRNMTIDGVAFSVYDIDLRKYRKSQQRRLMDTNAVSHLDLPRSPPPPDTKHWGDNLCSCDLAVSLSSNQAET